MADPPESTGPRDATEAEALRARIAALESALAESRAREAALTEDEQYYRLLVEGQSELVVRFDGECRLLYVSPSIERLLGVSSADVLGHSFLPFIHPEDLESVVEKLQALREPPHESRNEARAQSSNGWRWFEWHNRARLDAQGHVVEIIGVGRDVTDRHQALEALCRSEERYRDLVRNVPIGVFRTSLGPEGHYLAANPALAAIFGFESVESLLERSPASFYPDPEARGVWADKVLEAGAVAGEEVQLRRSDGSLFWAEVAARVITDETGKPELLDGTVTDISRRKAYEAAIARREAILEAIAFAAERFLAGGSWQAGMDAVLARLGTAAQCCRAYLFEVMAQDSPETWISQRFEWVDDGVEPQIDNPALQNAPVRAGGFSRWEEVMVQGGVIRGDISDFPPGERAALEPQGIQSVLAVPIFADQAWWGFLGFDAVRARRDWTDLDVDTLKTAARAIGAAVTRARIEVRRGQLERIIEHASEAVFTATPDGLVEYVNPAFTQMLGYAPEEVLGKPPEFFGTGEGPQHLPADMWPSLEAQGMWRGRMSHLCKDGRSITVEGTVSVIPDASGEMTRYVVVQRDVTGQDRIEAQLRQGQRMEALGTLAGGMAHDFRNILNSISGWLELVGNDLDPEAGARRHLDRATRACGRASELVNQVLTFSRKERQAPSPLAIGPVVREALRMLRSGLPDRVILDDQLEEVTAFASATTADVQQIIMNLGSNAAQAMPEGGVLTVHLSEVAIGTTECAQNVDFIPGQYLLLEVSDTGHGMTRDTLQHIFDPFYTTRGRGEGAGLGLAAVHGIVRSLNGVIDVTSAPRKGSTFRVYLPVCAVPEPEADPVAAMRDGATQGQESVVFLDDDPGLVEMMEIGLGAMGYRVTALTDPNAVVAAFETAPDDYDVLVTDQGMPGMSGVELADRVHAIRPGLPVVLVSGYSEGFSPDGLEAHGVGRLVIKPTGPQNVAAAIRAVIDQPGPTEPA